MQIELIETNNFIIKKNNKFENNSPFKLMKMKSCDTQIEYDLD